MGAAKDQRHFTKGSGIDTMDIAGIKEERAARCKKEKRTENCEKRKEAAAASASTAPSSSKSAQKKCISIRNAPLNLLSKRGETEEEEVVDMGGGGSEIEESKRSSVDIDNILNADEAPARRILCLEVIQRPPVVIRFGRVAKVGYLEK